MIKEPVLLETTDGDNGCTKKPENGDYYRALCHQLIMSQEQERRRLLRELGEHLTQHLAALSIEAGMLENAAEKSAAPLLKWIGNLKNLSVKLSEDAHLFCRQLYPIILEDLGLIEAIRSECFSFQQEERIRVRFICRTVPCDLPVEVSICIFRLVQEAFKNIGRHACASKVVVFVGANGDSLHLSVRDNGIGCDLKDTVKANGLGINTMRERVGLVGGSLDVKSKPGSGLQIRARIPLANFHPETEFR